jgi:hypothetical protein
LVASVQPYGLFRSSDSADMQRRHAFAYAVLEASGSERVCYTKNFRQICFNINFFYAFYVSFSEKTTYLKATPVMN